MSPVLEVRFDEASADLGCTNISQGCAAAAAPFCLFRESAQGMWSGSPWSRVLWPCWVRRGVADGVRVRGMNFGGTSAPRNTALLTRSESH